MSFRALAQEEPMPMPPVTVVPPDEAGNCPPGYSKQADGSCKKDASWISGISNTTVMIAGGGLLLLLLLLGRR